MTGTLDEEKLLRLYLLGDVSEDEQQRVEERLLTDDAYYNDLSRAEEDLIDSYVRSSLTPAERRRFETHFMNAPEHRESVAFAGVLQSCLAAGVSTPALSEAAKRKSGDVLPGFFYSISAGLRRVALYSAMVLAVLSATAVVLLLIQAARLRGEIERSRTEISALERQTDNLQSQLVEQLARNNQLEQDAARERPERERMTQELVRRPTQTASPVQPEVASLTLVPGVSRGDDRGSTVTLSRGVRDVRLSLVVTERLYDSYTAKLQTLEFKTLRTQSNLKPRPADRASIVVTIPARLLKGSQYLITLYGLGARGDQKIATYSFNVARE